MYLRVDTSTSRQILRKARSKIKKYNIKVPRLETYTDRSGWWEVFEKGKVQSESIIWKGYAANAYEARYFALQIYLENIPSNATHFIKAG